MHPRTGLAMLCHDAPQDRVGHAVPDVPQDRVGPPGCQGTMTRVQLATDQDLQIPFHGTALQHLIPQSVRTSRVVPPQVQNLTLSLVDLHLVGDCSTLQFIEVSLQGLPASEGVSSSFRFCIIWELAQYPFQSCLQVIYEDVEEHGAEDGALCYPTSDTSPI
ncbi:hypothetical protein DUI87_10494 [Hirundo rustica rustica]|uniref:Uncharacterized protein n=1 Tax=Hirundo rustica rustica TaxID=333673 RepID=A0A3M0L0P7_HIRRU|nr:hypothetical protein DUI87_10494 [Hirundo rustica rustica]